MSIADEKLSEIENSCRKLLTEGASEEEVLKSIRYYTVKLIDELQEANYTLYDASVELEDANRIINRLEDDLADQENMNDSHVTNVNRLFDYIKKLRQHVANPEFPELINSHEYIYDYLDSDDCLDSDE